MDKNKPMRVLFVGNSGTYVNNMPALFEKIARFASLDCRACFEAPDSVRFVQHASEDEECGRELRRLMREFKPTHVFFQENMRVCLGKDSRFPDENGRIACARAAKELACLARQNGAQPLFYIRTPYEYELLGYDEKAQRDVLTDFFGILGECLEIPCANAAEAFYISRSLYPHIDLYGPDRAHHSIFGSYLVACLCFVHLTGSSCRGLCDCGIGADTAALLQQAADKAAGL